MITNSIGLLLCSVLVTEEYKQDYKLVGALGIVRGPEVPEDWPEIEALFGVTIPDIQSGDVRRYVLPASSLRKVGQMAPQ